MNPSALICNQFAFSQDELYSYAQTCPYRYKTYPIKKRGGGHRIISQPSKDLKVIQRFILEAFLTPILKVHDAAKAYKIDTSILDNAEPHLKNRYLLKMDFKNFFPSILGEDFISYLNSHKIVKEQSEARLLARIFFKQDNDTLRLSIGSPGSPIISNALLFAFDEQVAKLCFENGVAYTRYSDDITFSTNHRDILFDWPDKIKLELERMKSPALKLNDKKTVFSSKKFNRHVTGITITNDGLPSIGRNKKRELRSRVFEAKKLSEKELNKLRGYIAFATQVEPGFRQILWKKYPVQMTIIMRPKSDDA